MQGSQKPQGFTRVTSQVLLQDTKKTNRRDLPRVTRTQTTSATLETLDPEKIRYIDYVIHTKLSHIITKRSFKYDGSAHTNWSRDVNHLYLKTKISTAKIEEYIAPLTKHIETIKYWNAENTLDTFSLLSRVGFFDQLDNLNKIKKEDVISLRNEFMNQISDTLHDIPLTEKKAISYISLLKNILVQINHDKNISTTSENLLDQICSTLMKTQELLSTYQYKEILKTITEIGNRIHKYVPIFKLIIYKHLDHMVNTEINSHNELNFVVYLSGITNLTEKNFPIEGKNKDNLIQLINKIKFIRDSEMAVLGLKSITALVDKKKIPLKAVENKINECIDFVQGKNLELYRVSLVLVCISKYISVLGSLPDNLKSVVDKYLSILVRNREILSLESLQSILKTFRNLVCFDYPLYIILKQISEVLDKKRIEFLNLSPEEIHNIITNLTKVLMHTKKEFNNHLILKLTQFLTTLMPKYLTTIIDIPLNERINSFITLSSLIDSGYLANMDMKTAFNSLLSKIDKEINALTQKQLINFFRVICLNCNLFTLQDEKIKEYANKLLELTKIQELSTKSISITVWCMLVFYESNYDKFNKRLSNKFNNAIISLYQVLDKEKKSNEIADPKSVGHVFAANWLGYKVKESFVLGITESDKDLQTRCFRILQTKFNELHFEEEQSINGLPPCDIVVHDKKIAIEVQGMHHFLDIERTLVNGTTILKNALLRKNDYHVIEVNVRNSKISDDEIKACFDKIEEILKQSQPLQKIKF